MFRQAAIGVSKLPEHKPKTYTLAVSLGSGGDEQIRRPWLDLAQLTRREYCDSVANITVSVPDAVYDAARLRAAEARTSVSALVRDYLTRIANEGSVHERLLAEQEAILNRIHERGPMYSASERMTRDEVHDRDALR